MRIEESFQFGRRWRADGTSELFRIETALGPDQMVKCYKKKVDAETYAKLWQEHNYHEGLQAIIRSGRFQDFPAIVFHFPPIKFNTHEMDQAGQWTMRVKQKSCSGRLRVTITNEDDWGFRFRLPARKYTMLEQVFEAASRCYEIELDASGLFKTVPKTRTFFQTEYVERPASEAVQEDITIALERHNQQTLEALGTRRAKRLEPDLTNVIPMPEQELADILRSIEADKISAGFEKVA